MVLHRCCRVDGLLGDATIMHSYGSRQVSVLPPPARQIKDDNTAIKRALLPATL